MKLLAPIENKKDLVNKEYVDNAVDVIEIGGTQILRGTNTTTTLGTASGGTMWETGSWRAASSTDSGIYRESIVITDAPNANIKLGWKLYGGVGTVDIAQDNVPIVSGNTYTLSCYARGSGILRLQYGKSQYASTAHRVSGDTVWSHYSMTFVANETEGAVQNGLTNIYFGRASVDGDSIEICGMKLEKGNKPTDWTPAPEDFYTTATPIGYGTCDTVAATAEKAVTISNGSNWTLTPGAMVCVKFTNTNTAQNPTLNVNGTGAKRIIYGVSLISTSNLGYAGYANRYINYVYNGTHYVFIGWSLDSNTTYSVATQSANGLLSAADKKKLDGIAEGADAVSATQKLTSGTEIGTITVNGAETKLYAPTSATTVKTVRNNDTTNNNKDFWLTFVDSDNAPASDENLYTSPGLRVQRTYGTAEALGKDQLVVGGYNQTRGIVTLYNGTVTGSLTTNTLTDQRSWVLPDKTGTIALTSDVPNNFGKVVVGSTTISADTKSDSLTLIAGDNVALTPDATNDKITISATDTTYSTMTGATSTAAGISGLVPAPAAGKQTSFLRGDGTWVVPTDTKVNTTLATTTKAYLLGTSTTPMSTAKGVTAVADTGVYLGTGAGTLYAEQFNANSRGGVNFIGDDFSKGDTPTEDPIYWTLGMCDKNGIAHANRLGYLATAVDTNGNVTIGIYAMPNVSGSTATNGIVTGIKPDGSSYIKLGSNTVGSATQPVYLNGGYPTACTYTLSKSVPSNAVFTDTKVTQAAAITTAGEYPIILGYNTVTTSQTNTVNKTSTLLYNPNTQTLRVPKINIYNGSSHSGTIESSSAIGLNLYSTGDNAGSLGKATNAFGGAYARALISQCGGAEYGRLHRQKEGTAEVTGIGTLVVGNSTGSGTAGNATGWIKMYGTGIGSTTVKPGYNSTGDIAITLPDIECTLPRPCNVQSGVFTASANTQSTTITITRNKFKIRLSVVGGPSFALDPLRGDTVYLSHLIAKGTPYDETVIYNYISGAIDYNITITVTTAGVMTIKRINNITSGMNYLGYSVEEYD